MLCLQHLERLHFALSQAALLKDAIEVPRDILAYMTWLRRSEAEEATERLTAGLPDDEPDRDGENVPGGTDVDEVDSSIEAGLKRLTQQAITVHKSLPLENLIRYFMKDPYYELVRSVPELRLHELYVSVLRLRILAELESIFPEIRSKVVERK